LFPEDVINEDLTPGASAYTTVSKAVKRFDEK